MPTEKLQALLYIMLCVVILMSGAIILNSPGWILILIGIIIFPIVLLVHSLIHILAIRKRPWIPAIVISHILLLSAVLFRVDSGDRSSYVAVDVIARNLGIDFHAPAWMAGPTGQMFDLLLFILTAISWLFVFPFSDPKLAGRIVIAVLLPWWHFYDNGRPVAALLSFGLVMTMAGWVLASIWAFCSLIGSKMEKTPEVDS